MGRLKNILMMKHCFSSFFDDDYITPHNDKYKDPFPLRFLKVSPNVTFKFYFELSNGIIGRENKLRLFDKILLDLGVGAKTNVGYEQFIGDNEKNILEELDKKEKEKEQKALKRKEFIEGILG
jgi:CRISPR-associated protein Cmr6